MKNIFVKISEELITPDCAVAELADPAHGGQNIFSGIVRNFNHGRSVVAVAYDCFVPLAAVTLKKIAEEACELFGGNIRVVIWHRIGKIPVGELSVLVGVSSPHRDEAYRASRYAIEELKTRAPIWKKEFYTDGETEWLRGHELCAHAHPRKDIDAGGKSLEIPSPDSPS